MAQLLADENFAFPVVEELRRLSHDVLTWAETGQANLAISDEVVLETATKLKRVVITLNRKDFINLHAEKPSHAGIIVCTMDNDFAGLAGRIHELLVNQPDMNGRLERVNRPSK